MFKLGIRSRYKLKGVHPDLIKVVERAIDLTMVDFTVGEGLRTLERQKQLFKAGASKTMRSRHLTGHAVDLWASINGRIEWAWPLYSQIATAMKQASKELDIPVDWGGDWESFKDGAHFQLSYSQYP